VMIVGLSIIPCYAGNFGALAYDSANGASGWSWDHPNQASANAGALQRCAQYGSNCQGVAEVPGGCGAFATGANSSRAAIGSTLAAAQQAALNYCNIYGGLDDCVVKVSVCNSPPGSVRPQPRAPVCGPFCWEPGCYTPPEPPCRPYYGHDEC